MDAYLFVHFVGTESVSNHEQIYFSVSKDGRTWKILNDGQPVLSSDVGEKGVRDPYIIRSLDGKHFYIIATDLSIHNRMKKTEEKTAWKQATNGFTDNPTPGSQCVVIWESEDLVTWSQAKLIQVAPFSAGCFWAPKCIWDKEKQAYMVVGASKMPEDDYEWLRLYRIYTTDFRTFTEAELYMELSSDSKETQKHVFDCTFIEYENRYYRIYKTDCIQIDVADSLSGIWTPIPTNIQNIAPYHEGPAICQENHKNTCMLMLDCLKTHGGYQPFITDNLQNAQFAGAVEESSFPETVKYRHGSLLPISQAEYKALVKNYTRRNEMEHKTMQMISENFELRYISQDAKAEGETDFKGETSTLTTEERIDYLNEYARRIPGFFDDFSLEKQVVTIETAKERLKRIKSQPQPQARKRLQLDDWNWIGYKEKKERDAFSDIRNTVIPKQNWRCFMEWALEANSDYSNTVFSLGSAAVLGFDAEQTPYYMMNKQTVIIDKIQSLQKIKIELDFVYRKWNLYFNDQLEADFIDFTEPETEEITYFEAPIENRPRIISHIWGVGYHRLEENLFEPFRIETFIDENFSAPIVMENWNQPIYDDACWQSGTLPIVHGGERYAGEDIYLRKNFSLDTIMAYSELYLESLTPGGEIYMNGRLIALIKDECCHKIDVSDYVQPGENLIAIKVYADEVKSGEKMTHTHTDRYTGWFAGRMHLDLLPSVYLEDVFSYTESIDEERTVQKVEVSVKAQRALPSALIKEHEIYVRMMSWFPDEGDICAEKSWQTSILPNISETTKGDLEISNPKLWTSNTPNLYKIIVELKDLSGNVLDDYVITTGIRTVSQKDGIFCINGMPELLRAPLLFGARAPMDKIAAWDRCPPSEYYIQEMLMIRGMNGNGIRMSVHDKRIGGINDPRICELADQMGLMLVWQTSTWLRVSSATNLNYDEMAVCIRQVRNHCSIVMWQPTNHPSWKNWDTVMRVYGMMHNAITALDRSRLISPSADSRRMRPRWDDGLTDFEGNKVDSCDSAWTAEGICRGNMDYILGYGNEWSALRQWPNVDDKNLPDYMDSTAYIPSYINSKSRAYFNFEHDEIIGQPNWNVHKGKPTYRIGSYEYYYDEGSIGRELSFDEWLTSQAWQALGSYEVICKCRWLDYDGLCWCNLRGGVNTGTYQKSLIDYYGQPKLAYYIHQMAFQDVLACSGNVDIVYGPKDTIPVTVLNIGVHKTVNVKVEIQSEDETVVFEKEFSNVNLEEGRSAVTIEDMKIPKLQDGLYSFVYTVYL